MSVNKTLNYKMSKNKTLNNKMLNNKKLNNKISNNKTLMLQNVKRYKMQITISRMVDT